MGFMDKKTVKERTSIGYRVSLRTRETASRLRMEMLVGKMFDFTTKGIGKVWKRKAEIIQSGGIQAESIQVSGEVPEPEKGSQAFVKLF